MRMSVVSLAVALLAASLGAGPARVTVITKDGRLGGTLSAAGLDVQTASKGVGVPLADVASVQFGDAGDVVRTRDGKRIKGTVRVDGWSLKEKEAGADRPLARADLRFLVPQAPIGPLKRGKVVDA